MDHVGSVPKSKSGFKHKVGPSDLQDFGGTHPTHPVDGHIDVTPPTSREPRDREEPALQGCALWNRLPPIEVSFNKILFWRACLRRSKQKYRCPSPSGLLPSCPIKRLATHVLIICRFRFSCPLLVSGPPNRGTLAQLVQT